MTAFAAQSGSNDALWSPDRLQPAGAKAVPGTAQLVTYQEARDKDGKVVDANISRLSPEAAKSLGSEVKVADAFRAAGYDVDTGTDFIPVWTGDINFRNGIPTGGGVVVFNADQINRNNGNASANDGTWRSQQLQPGDTVYVMLETYEGSGAWEIYSAVVGPNGDFNVTIPHGGALVVTKVMSDGTVITLNKSTGEVINRVPADNVANNNASSTTSTSTTASAATSPKTGEF